MPNNRKAALCLLAIGQLIIPVAAQSTGEELRPELGIYIQQGPLIRVELVDSFSAIQSTHDWQGDFAFYVETALKPIFRQEPREQPDVYRNKYLALRVGYGHQASLTNANSTSENRAENNESGSDLDWATCGTVPVISPARAWPASEHRPPH